jgi:hypothetical protein
VIRLGLRLAVAGGREAVGRLTLIAVAVAIGAGLLLTTLSGIDAVNAQNAKYAWLETGYTDSAAPAGSSGIDPLWWRLRADYYQGGLIGRVDVAATGTCSPVPPGIPALPGAGQFYASPAMAELLRRTPADQLDDRYPGTLAGTIGEAALPAPDSLVIIVGHSVADLAQQPGAQTVTRISTTVPSSCRGDCAFGVGTNDNGITLILTVVAAALLFPVLVFIGGATRLSAARREQRFAAMRLVGATPRQVAAIATVESTVAAVAGVVLGFALFFALRPAIAAIPFTGAPFFTADLTPNLRDVLLVGVGIPVGAAVAARLALRRVTVSPLGISRRVTPRAPRAWRVLPLIAGLGWLAYLAYVSDIGASKDTGLQSRAYLAGVLTVMAGLVIAGPWLTMLGSRLMARRAQRPATLIAGRRLADDPKAGFRAISGLVLAIFIGTGAIGVISTISAYNGVAVGDPAATDRTLVHQFFAGDRPEYAVGSVAEATISDLTAVPGVQGVTVIHVAPAKPQAWLGVASCSQLATTPVLGRCPAGAETALVAPQFGSGVINTSSPMAERVWPAATVTPQELAALPVDSIVVGTDGSTAAVERARTVLGLAYPRPFPPQTLTEYNAHNTELIDQYRRLADVAILVSLPIAGCSLAVAVAGGLADRRRPFSLLRLTGTPLGVLRRVVLLESAVPLLVTAVLSAGVGLVTAQLFLRAQLGQTIQPLGPAYYVLVGAGLLASLAVIASTLPLLARTTGPETARND